MRIITPLLVLAVAFVCSCGPSSSDIKLQRIQDSLRQAKAISEAVEKVKEEMKGSAPAPAAKPANVSRPTTQMVSTPKSGSYVRILRNNVILRNAPSTSAYALKHAYAGNEFRYLGTYDDWYMVSYNGTTAYVYGGIFNGHYLCDVVDY